MVIKTYSKIVCVCINKITIMTLSFATTLIIGFIFLNEYWVETRHQRLGENDPGFMGFHLLQDLQNETGTEKNVIISSSAGATLMDLYLGAAGKTRQELKQLFNNYRRTEPNKRVPTNTPASKQTLNKTDQRNGLDGSPTNIFVRKDFTFQREYIHNVTQPELLELVTVNFSTKAATEEINKLVSNITFGQIRQIYDGAVDPSTQFVLFVFDPLLPYGFENAFPTSKTKPEKFFTGKSYVDVDMMNDQQLVYYSDNPAVKYEVIIISDSSYHMGAMCIVLPYEDQTLENMTRHMKADDYNAIWDSTNKTIIDYKIPKMNFSTVHSLKSVLQKEGLNSIFEKPDFKPMTTSTKLRVADVYNLNLIQINETMINVTGATAMRFSKYSSQEISKMNKKSNTSPATDPRSIKDSTSPFRKSKKLSGVKSPKTFHVNRPFMLMMVYQFWGMMFQSFVHQPNGDSIEVNPYPF